MSSLHFWPVFVFDIPQLSPADTATRIQESILSAPEMHSWEASVTATLYDMDSNWEPKKKTVIEKLTSVQDKVRAEHILSATEYSEDQTTDRTARFKVEAAKLNRKNARRKQTEGKRKSGGHRGMDLERDELFPFGDDKAKDYEFSFLPSTLLAGQKVFVLETRSLRKSSDYFEGKYFIHPETFDVLRAEIRPAKYPVPLKLLQMHLDFERLPEGYLVVRTARVRIHVGLVIKNIRMETEEVYSSYKVRE